MSRGRDGLYRRENQILAFRYKDPEGAWREKYTGTTNRQEARKIRDEFKLQLNQGTLPTEMGEWSLETAKNWWYGFRRPRVATATLESERYRIHHLIRILGNKRLREINNIHLDRYVSGRLEEGIGAWSINKEVILWSLILKKAKLWSRLREDYKPLRTKASDIGRAMTREELHRLANLAQSNVEWEAALYGSILAANTGLRGGEIKNLRVGAIDVKSKCLIIRRRDAKTDASARHIELNRDGMNAAERLLLRARTLGAERPDHYLMPKNLSRIVRGPDKGKRGYDPAHHQKCWGKAWRNLTREAGLESFRFHDVRHTFITHMVERGVPLGVIQTFVGHISVRMVRHYTHITSGAARRAVELFDNDPLLTEPANLAEPRNISGAFRIN